MSVIDLHCDSLTISEPLTGAVTVEKMCAGDALAQCFAVFIDQKEQNICPDGEYLYFLDRVEVYRGILEKERDRLAPALCPEDVARNRREGKISAILTVEDGGFLASRPERVAEAFEKGVRMISLTWNYPNCLGFPNSDDPEKDAEGLTDFGRLAVEEMNARGIIVDVSHLNRGGFFEVARRSKKPFVASHSCAYSLCPHSRNLTDEQLKIIGERGGVVGLNFYSRFLRPDCEYSLVEDMVRHARHIADRAGVAALALGSDFDGIETPVEFGDWAGYPRLIEALSRYFTPAEMDGVCRENFLRVWTDCLGG